MKPRYFLEKQERMALVGHGNSTSLLSSFYMGSLRVLEVNESDINARERDTSPRELKDSNSKINLKEIGYQTAIVDESRF